MKSEGYIKIFRTIQDWEWIGNPNMVCLWFHLLLLANWEDEDCRGFIVPRGSLVTTRKQLASITGLTEQQVRCCAKNLQNSQQITIKTTNKYSLITICNYESYQGSGGAQQPAKKPTNNQQNRQQTTSKTTPNTMYLNSKILEENKERNNTLTGVKKDIAESVESFFEAHTFSENFMSTWAVLTAQPKWKGKTQNALVMSLKKLARYKEPFAIMLMEDAIENNWQGVVFPPRPGVQGTEERYQQWLGEQAKAEDRQRATEGMRRAAEIQRQQQELEKRKARQEVEAARAAGFKPQWGPNAQKKATTPQEDDAAHRMKIQEQIRQIQTGQFNF